ncbi:hypothetical protein [Goodfellowiella coeruleoviolacea]|uniref:DUF2613 domain-containing protein n=1 Tax=Goodfellowiella coeruleoviolacea TaxID=334858 RepID=A0AAE3GGT4_9PSEU|nr:hypothetical protein [Goodfellowiella coeruleoviolacea]MCP2167085.1 hypothetical protein [Goodfellowiella coeruleoviolacea]
MVTKMRSVAGVLVGVIAVVGLLVFGLASLGLQSAVPRVDPRPPQIIYHGGGSTGNGPGVWR